MTESTIQNDTITHTTLPTQTMFTQQAGSLHVVTLVVHPWKKRDPATDQGLGFKVKVSGKFRFQ